MPSKSKRARAPKKIYVCVGPYGANCPSEKRKIAKTYASNGEHIATYELVRVSPKPTKRG